MNHKILISSSAVILAIALGSYFLVEKEKLPAPEPKADATVEEDIARSQEPAVPRSESSSIAYEKPQLPEGDAQPASASTSHEDLSSQRLSFSPSEMVRSRIKSEKSPRKQWNLITEYYSKEMGMEQAKQELSFWSAEPNSSTSLLARSVLYKRWAEADEPLPAMQDALQHTASIMGSEGRRAVLSAGAFRILGLEEPSEAIALLKDERYSSMLLETVSMRSDSNNMGTTLVGDGRWEELEQWAEGWEAINTGEKSAASKRRFYAAVGTKLAERDFSQAEAAFAKLPDESLRIESMSTFALAKAAEAPRDAADWVRNLDSLNREGKGQVLAGQVEGWTGQEGGYEDALAYIAEMDESVDLDPSLLKLLEATPSDQYQTRIELMDSIQDPRLRDDATATFVSSSPGLGDQNRLDLALTIESPEVRDETIRELVYEVWREDEKAANTMIESLQDKYFQIDFKSGGG